MKRFVFILLSAIICLSILCSCSSNSAPELDERAPNACGKNVTWSFEDGVLTISGKGDMWDFDSTLDSPWRFFRPEIEKVVINEGVNSVGNFAFDGCRNLTEVSLPQSLKTIGEKAFCDNYSIGKIYIPSGITLIEKGAFKYCDGLMLVSYGGSAEDWEYVKVKGENSPLLNANFIYMSY